MKDNGEEDTIAAVDDVHQRAITSSSRRSCEVINLPSALAVGDAETVA